MKKREIDTLSDEISSFKKTRELYKKRFWIGSRAMDYEQRRLVRKLFMKIDRLRNHLKLWLRLLISNKASNRDNYVQLINKGKIEIQNSFKQLDRIMQKQVQ